MNRICRYMFAGVLGFAAAGAFAEERTFGERLGWGAEERVLIFHNDDVGMSHESNLGNIEAFEYGLVTSCSTMMPCSWVLEWRDYMNDHPDLDNGLHLTLTSEWKHYRWGPVAGRDAVPGLIDSEGYMHRSVQDTIQHASADEIETEIRAQIALAEEMGLPVTHLDSHMGTLFYSPAFLERYLKVGIEKQIPVMIMSGRGMEPPMRQVAERAAATAWEGGLPVLDYLITAVERTGDAEELVSAAVETLRNLPPGITQIIVHATRNTDNFRAISASGPRREAELMMVLSPEVKQVIEEEGIILTTYKEMMERRQQVEAP